MMQVGRALEAPHASAFADLTLVVPTFNEVGNVGALLRTLESHVPGARVILADDDSRDGTRDAARLFRGDLSVEVLHRRQASDRGLTASVADAILRVQTDYLVVMDADLQHPATVIGELIARLKSGADVAIATREDDDSFNWRRKLVSRGGRALARRHLRRHIGVAITDPMSGFFAMRADAARTIVQERGGAFERPGFKVLIDLLLGGEGRLNVAEVPYTFGKRNAGESKLSSRHYLSLLRQLGPMGKLTAGLLDIVLTGILFKFLAVGATGVLVNSFTLFGFHEGFGLPLVYATIFAIEASVLWNFAWNESWTFRGRGHDSMGRRLTKFHIASALGMVIMFTTVALGHRAFPDVWYMTLNLVGIGLGSAANLLINLNWTWGVAPEDIERDLD